jgi:hypothetical protein
MRWKERKSGRYAPGDIVIIVEICLGGVHKVHARLAIRRTSRDGVGALLEDFTRTTRVLAGRLIFLGDVNAAVFVSCRLFSTNTSEFHELYSCSTNRMGPIFWTFSVGDTASDLIEEIRGWNWTIKRCE